MQKEMVVLGEGAGAIILEEYDRAVARGAKIYAEVMGVNLDAHHMTAPHPEGIGVVAVMKNCLKIQNCSRGCDRLNTHGTSTPGMWQVKAISKVFGGSRQKHQY